MQQLILNIEENRYSLLLQFLKTLDYVSVVQPIQVVAHENTSNKRIANGHQLALLRQQLEQMTKPLLQDIADPVAWQKQQRDEWS